MKATRINVAIAIIHKRRHTPIGVSGVVCDVWEVQNLQAKTYNCSHGVVQFLCRMMIDLRCLLRVFKFV